MYVPSELRAAEDFLEVIGNPFDTSVMCVAYCALNVWSFSLQLATRTALV